VDHPVDVADAEKHHAGGGDADEQVLQNRVLHPGN
jgi:hypothetical protein